MSSVTKTGARMLRCSVRGRVLSQAPRRALVPLPHSVVGPRRSLIRMTRSAWIGNFVFLGHCGRDEAESVSVNHRIRWAFRFNRGHVASDTLTACASFLVVRVFLEGCCSWTVRG
jgi:hypothetical protein